MANGRTNSPPGDLTLAEGKPYPVMRFGLLKRHAEHSKQLGLPDSLAVPSEMEQGMGNVFNTKRSEEMNFAQKKSSVFFLPVPCSVLGFLFSL